MSNIQGLIDSVTASLPISACANRPLFRRSYASAVAIRSTSWDAVGPHAMVLK